VEIVGLASLKFSCYFSIIAIEERVDTARDNSRAPAGVIENTLAI